jgi:two-component system chemotaxis response regulator CheB
MSIKVLIVDDSAVMRQTLNMLLSQCRDIDVVGMACDAFEAREKIKMLNPDVLTLDIEMPKMNGLAFLEKLMRLHPMPVVMVSSLTSRHAEATLLALQLGAVDVVAKPVLCSQNTMAALSLEICEKIKCAASAKVDKIFTNAKTELSCPMISANNIPVLSQQAGSLKLLAMAASTGGVEAFHCLLGQLKPPLPPVVIVQHMPRSFTRSFAERLNSQHGLEVREAEDGEILQPSMVRIAPGDYHLEIDNMQGQVRTRLHRGPEICGHRPAADLLFVSVAEAFGPQAMGVVLTGMGQDGAEGLLHMKRSGALTIAQDKPTSLVYGMPRAALEKGAICAQFSLNELATFIRQISQVQDRHQVA